MDPEPSKQPPHGWRQWRKALLLGAVAAIAVIGLPCAMVVTPAIMIRRSIPTEAELRERLAFSGDLEMLVTWSRDWLAQAEPADHLHTPPALQAAGVHWVLMIGPEPNEPTHVWIEFGGGFHHYGLLIGEPDFIPQPSSTHGTLRKWSDGVWYRSDALE